jgi:flagellar hook-associated protein 1 FlgK
MSLTSALNIAAQGLALASGQTALVSRNVANANDPDYARKSAALASLPGGGAIITGYRRAADAALLVKLLDAGSAHAGKQAYLEGLERLAATVGDPEAGTSIAGYMQKLRDALQVYESDPSNTLNANGAARAAGDVARALNAATSATQDTRRQADQDMLASVDHVNSLLRQFKAANDAIVNGDGTRADLTAELDTRDRVLKELSQEIGIRTVTRSRNDIAIYTDGGVTLFDKVPRAVTMQATPLYTTGTVGQHVYVDGIAITDPASTMATRSGRLHGLAMLRDTAAVTYQEQLDEVARGLIESFAERDRQIPPVLPNAVGLLTYPGAPAIPPTGSVITGLAASIRLNPLSDPEQGGDARLIRDGGLAGAAYVANTTAASGYSARIAELIDGLGANRAFDPAAGLAGQANLMSYGASSAGWIEAARSAASAAADTQAALETRAADALHRETGVNIDEEMTVMLDLERSYQASSKIISVVDAMLAALLAVT